MTKRNIHTKSEEGVKEAYKCLIRSFIVVIAAIWVFLEKFKLAIALTGAYLVGQLTDDIVKNVIVNLIVHLLLHCLEGS